MNNILKKLQLVNAGKLGKILELLTSQIKNNRTVQELKVPDLSGVLCSKQQFDSSQDN